MTFSNPEKIQNIRIQLIENVYCDNISRFESKIWQHEKVWQTQLFTVSTLYLIRTGDDFQKMCIVLALLQSAIWACSLEHLA